MTDIQVVDNRGGGRGSLGKTDAGRFDIVVDGEPAGFVAYRRAGSTIELNHTEIDPEFEGRGLGSVLVREALDRARAGSLAVLPFCPFVRRYIQRHREYVDLVPVADRPRFDLAG
jgi:predicted GNAT family acetyltransferase